MGNHCRAGFAHITPIASPARVRDWWSWCYWSIIALLVLIMGAGQTRQVLVSFQSVPPAGQAPAAADTQPAVPAGPTPMAVPLQLIAEARQSYQEVKNYTCLFVKRERLRGELQAENLIAMKVRTQPFSVYLRWAKPDALAGQEACYVAGSNNGMMRVHATGLLGLAGFVSLDPRDPRALENSRHSIMEAGIGNLIERFGKRWELENRWNITQTRILDYAYDKRRCTRVETIHPDNTGKRFLFYRSVIYFDKENHLPIRVENYDWPRAGGDPNGTLAESYSYADLHLNVEMSDATFNH